MIFTLHCPPQESQQLVRRDLMRTEPAIPLFFYPDVFGNTCKRLEAPPGLLRVTTDGIMDDCGINPNYILTNPNAPAPAIIRRSRNFPLKRPRSYQGHPEG